MYQLKVGVGVVLCALGGWQLAGLTMDDGTAFSASGSSSKGVISSDNHEWGPRCDKMAKALFRESLGSGPGAVLKLRKKWLQLNQQGCNPEKAPAGAIPNMPGMDMMGGSGPGRQKQEPSDWGGEGGASRDAKDGWGG